MTNTTNTPVLTVTAMRTKRAALANYAGSDSAAAFARREARLAALARSNAR